MTKMIIANEETFAAEGYAATALDEAVLVVTGQDETIIEDCDFTFVTTPATPVLATWSISFSEDDVGIEKGATLRLRRGGLDGAVLASQVFTDVGDADDGLSQTWAGSFEDVTPGDQYVLTIQETSGSSSTDVYVGAVTFTVHSITVAGADPVTWSEYLGLSLSFGVPTSVSSVSVPETTMDTVYGTYAKALLETLYETHPDGWFVIRNCPEGVAASTTDFLAYRYPPQVTATFDSGTEVDDSSVDVNSDLSVVLSGDSSYGVSGGVVSRTDADDSEFVLFDALTSRGTLRVEFSEMADVDGSAVIFNYEDEENFWRVAYQNPGWQIEQIIGGIVEYSGVVIGTSDEGPVTLELQPTGVLVTSPDGLSDFADNFSLATQFGFVLKGDGSNPSSVGALYWMPSFQIEYYKPGTPSEVQLIPDCGSVAALGSSALIARATVDEGSVATVTTSVTGDTAYVGTVPNARVMEKMGAITPTVQFAPINHRHGRESADVQVFIENGTWVKPSSVNIVEMTAIGGGGGGGSGGLSQARYVSYELPSTIDVEVGLGGAGGGSQSVDSTDGINGAEGGTSRVGVTTSYVSATGGTGGAGGTSTESGDLSSGGRGSFPGCAGGNINVSELPASAAYTASGGGGGPIGDDDSESDGQDGGVPDTVVTASPAMGGEVPGERGEDGGPTVSLNAYSQQVLSRGSLHGYWKGDDASGTVATDYSGWGNHGEYSATGVTLNQVGGVADGSRAVEFDGVSGSLTILDDPAFIHNDEFSIIIWISRNGGFGQSQDFFDMGTGNAQVLFGDGSHANKITVSKRGIGVVARSLNPIDDTEWHHIAVTKRQSDIHIYIDGVDDTGATANLPMDDVGANIIIGSNGALRWLNALWQHASFYVSALSADEILEDYESGLASPRSPVGGTGGAGGAASTSGDAGRGGHGGIGGGGGGGGASADGDVSGSGGDGGRGVVVITSW